MKKLAMFGVAVLAASSLAVLAEEAKTEGKKNVSDAAENNGLEVTLAVSEKLRAASGLAFSVSIKNVKKPEVDLTLIDAERTEFWSIRIKEVGKDGFWQVERDPMKEIGLGAPKPTRLKPGESLKVEVNLQPKNIALMWQGTLTQPSKALAELPEGQYELSVEFELRRRDYIAAANPVWEGRIKTKPVQFTLVGPVK